MKAIIMAGGEGTRLRPLTCSNPKPLSLLCGRPVVHYILDLFNHHGFDEAIFTLGYKSEQIEQMFENGRYKNLLLRFSHEETPLGTAGCVKKAAQTFSCDNESFLVISGDALCDFDLAAAVAEHTATSAAATVITSQVEDPREFGLVIGEDGSERLGKQSKQIVGFSEKPSYLGCISDYANTGVYVLSPSVLDLVPDNVPCDFARDIFPRMLKNPDVFPLRCLHSNGYWCDIGDFSSYAKSQFDILSGKVKCDRSALGAKLAEGIYSKSRIPNNVILTSPCYIGENVTFSNAGAGTVQVTSSVIGDNVNIGNNVKLRGSVILDSAFISDGATVNHAVICNNAKLLHSASVYEGSVIGESCLVGREAIVSNGAKVWNGKTIPTGASVTRDVKYGGSDAVCRVELSDKGIRGETNADITPEFCARLGAALACTISGTSSAKRVAVSCEGNCASKALKYAIISGTLGAAADVFDMDCAPLPQLIYASKLLNCGIVAHIKCGIFAEITLLGNSGLALTRQGERRLEAALTRSEYKNADHTGFGRAHQIGKEFNQIYTSMLYSHARLKSNHKIKLNCNCSDSEYTKCLEQVFNSVSNPHGEVLVVTLSDNTSTAEFYTENSTKISYEQLMMLAAAHMMKQGSDVALPNSFTSCADFLAASYAKQIHRYFSCPNDSSDSKARELAAKQAFLYDGAILALTVLEYLSECGQSIEDAIKAIPQFVCEKREIDINCPPQRIISRLCDGESGGCGKGEGVLLGNTRENVLVRSTKRGKSLVLLAQSLSSETATQLCDNAEELVKKIMAE